MLLLVDLDGVVYRGERPVPGMPRLLARRVAAGDVVVYVTNNSRWHRHEYLGRLQRMGAPVDPALILTAARATALALAEEPRLVANGLAMVLGGPGLAQELRDVGLATVAPSPYGLFRRPGALVVGVDFALSYRRLSIAAEAVRRGATFVATNRDHVYPTPAGLAAGAGTIVAAVAVAVGQEPDLVVGKPEPRLFEEAARAAGMPLADAVVIGDGLLTDVLAARRVGARSVLMLTGVTTPGEAAAARTSAGAPTAVARDARELAVILEGLATTG
ncbi:MAG: HAD-IIA family hydrolase [Candidatus Limnocylindrales bacterium]